MPAVQVLRRAGLLSYSPRGRSTPSHVSSAMSEFDRAACVGTFATLPQVEHAVRQLRAVGFSRRNITVVCCEGPPPDRIAINPCRENESIAGTGGIVGAALGALALIVSTTLDGGTVLFAGGPASVWSGSALAGLVGATGLLGVQQDAAERYRATVEEGSIVVVVDSADVVDEGMLATAVRILDEAGRLPLATPTD